MRKNRAFEILRCMVVLVILAGLLAGCSKYNAALGPEMLQAARGRNYSKVEELLDQRADPNAQNNDGWTVLHYASMHGRRPVVQNLIDAGADPNIPNNEGWTPLMAASQNGKSEIARALLEAGTDADAVDRWGVTPAEYAKRGGYTEIIDLLRE